jgi:hypothetical protein
MGRLQSRSDEPVKDRSWHIREEPITVAKVRLVESSRRTHRDLQGVLLDPEQTLGSRDDE